MGIGRKIINAGEKVSRFFAYELKNRYYKVLFNKEMAKAFEGRNNKLSKEYKKSINALWLKRYKIKVDKRWFAHYSHCYGVETPYYIPDNIFHSKIEPYFNNDEYVACMSNKNFFDRWLPSIKHAKIFVRNIRGVWYDYDFNKLTEEEVINKTKSYDEFVAKQCIDSAGGAGVVFVSEKLNRESLSELSKKFSSDFVFQEIIKQHKSLSQINQSSVNTIRLMTLNYRGEVTKLSAVLRMGIDGKRVDNMVSGGVNCAIRDDGSLVNKLYNSIGKLFIGHPNSGSVEDKKIINFEVIVNMALTAHKQLPYMGLISWDFAIDENGEPILIEFNLKPQGLDLHQRENGPIFGDKTTEILDDIFGFKGDKNDR